MEEREMTRAFGPDATESGGGAKPGVPEGCGTGSKPDAPEGGGAGRPSAAPASHDEAEAAVGRCTTTAACCTNTADDPYRPRWMDIADPNERQCAHIIDNLGFCGHYIHMHGGGRSGRAPILCTLRKRGDEMLQREFMDKFELKPGSLSELLSKIERDGLIERTRDAADRRQLNVRLTDEGRAWADAEQLRREKFRAGALSCLTNEERAQLEDMLTRIRQHWRSIDD